MLKLTTVRKIEHQVAEWRMRVDWVTYCFSSSTSVFVRRRQRRSCTPFLHYDAATVHLCSTSSISRRHQYSPLFTKHSRCGDCLFCLQVPGGSRKNIWRGGGNAQKFATIFSRRPQNTRHIFLNEPLRPPKIPKMQFFTAAVTNIWGGGKA